MFRAQGRKFGRQGMLKADVTAGISVEPEKLQVISMEEHGLVLLILRNVYVFSTFILV